MNEFGTELQSLMNLEYLTMDWIGTAIGPQGVNDLSLGFKNSHL